MSVVLINDSTLTDIADAIREQNGSSDTYYPSDMADAIAAIEGGGGVEIPDINWEFEGDNLFGSKIFL